MKMLREQDAGTQPYCNSHICDQLKTRMAKKKIKSYCLIYILKTVGQKSSDSDEQALSPQKKELISPLIPDVLLLDRLSRQSSEIFGRSPQQLEPSNTPGHVQADPAHISTVLFKGISFLPTPQNFLSRSLVVFSHNIYSINLLRILIRFQGEWG